MKKGKEYELLVEKIFRDLHKSDAIIKQDDFIYGHESLKERQIDVSIRYTHAEIEFLLIVQAKDLTRPADIKVVDEFISVIKDVRADKGVLICSGGFTRQALKYAEGKNIKCYKAHSALRANWQLEINLPAIRYENIFEFHADMNIHVIKTSEPFQLSLYEKMFKKDGKIVSLADLFTAAIAGVALDKSGKEQSITPDTKGFFYNSENEWIELKTLTFHYKYKRSIVKLGLFSPEEYRALQDYSKDRIIHTYIGLGALVPMLNDPLAWKTDKEKGKDFDFTAPHIHIQSNNLSIIYSYECKFIKG